MFGIYHNIDQPIYLNQTNDTIILESGHNIKYFILEQIGCVVQVLK